MRAKQSDYGKFLKAGILARVDAEDQPVRARSERTITVLKLVQLREYPRIGAAMINYARTEPSPQSAAWVRLSKGRWGRHQTIVAVPASEFWNDTVAATRALDAIETALRPSNEEQILAIPAISAEQFSLNLYIDAKGIVGCFGGLSYEFNQIDEGLAWVWRALSSEYRLHIISVRGRPCEWLLESTANADVVMASRIGSPLRRWSTPTHLYKTNGLLRAQARGEPRARFRRSSTECKHARQFHVDQGAR